MYKSFALKIRFAVLQVGNCYHGRSFPLYIRVCAPVAYYLDGWETGGRLFDLDHIQCGVAMCIFARTPVYVRP